MATNGQIGSAQRFKSSIAHLSTDTKSSSKGTPFSSTRSLALIHLSKGSFQSPPVFFRLLSLLKRLKMHHIFSYLTISPISDFSLDRSRTILLFSGPPPALMLELQLLH